MTVGTETTLRDDRWILRRSWLGSDGIGGHRGHPTLPFAFVPIDSQANIALFAPELAPGVLDGDVTVIEIVTHSEHGVINVDAAVRIKDAAAVEAKSQQIRFNSHADRLNKKRIRISIDRRSTDLLGEGAYQMRFVDRDLLETRNGDSVVIDLRRVAYVGLGVVIVVLSGCDAAVLGDPRKGRIHITAGTSLIVDIAIDQLLLAQGHQRPRRDGVQSFDAANGGKRPTGTTLGSHN